jgi:hypothetical protein
VSKTIIRNHGFRLARRAIRQVCREREVDADTEARLIAAVRNVIIPERKPDAQA